MITVYILSKSSFIPEGIRVILKPVSFFRVAGVAQSLEEFSKLPSLEADVLLMDAGVNRSPEKRIEIIQAAVKKNPGLKVIVFNGRHYVPHRVESIIEAGAAGYISKYCDHNPMLKAIETVMNNEIFLCPLSAQEVAHQYVKNDDKEKIRLNGQEKKIIRLLAQGNFNEEVADLLGISRRTVNVIKLRVILSVCF